MNKNENSQNPEEDVQSEELLNELRPQLGLADGPASEKYKDQFRHQYLLPKLLLLLALLAVLAVLILVLLLPSMIINAEAVENYDGMTVSFDVNRLALLDSVTATLDGKPITVEQVDKNSYQVSAPRNGMLLITTCTFTNRTCEAGYDVLCVDNDAPHLGGDELKDGTLYIYFTDEGGAGIDWETLSITLADSGKEYRLGEIDEENDCVSLPLPDSSLRLYVEDRNGNPLSALLTIEQPEEPEETEETDTEEPPRVRTESKSDKAADITEADETNRNAAAGNTARTGD